MNRETNRATPTKIEILERNRLEYDDAADLYWRLTVYDAIHSGWWFSNIGGRHVLDVIGEKALTYRDPHVLELCSGLGDACRYLAITYGCRMTGVEINARQVARARENLSADATIGSRVRFIEADVLAWQPDARYHVVFALDSLMLLEDRPAVLQSTRRALVPCGSAVFADVLAGPAITDAVRAFIWTEDGIVDLPEAGAQRRLLDAAGFDAIELHDMTELAAERFWRIAAAAGTHEAPLVKAKGRPRFDRWLTNARVYAKYFQTRALTYVLMTASTP